MESVLLGVVEPVGAQEELDLQLAISPNAHSQFLSGHSSSQVPHVVHLLVAQDFGHHVSC